MGYIRVWKWNNPPISMKKNPQQSFEQFSRTYCYRQISLGNYSKIKYRPTPSYVVIKSKTEVTFPTAM